MHSCTDVNMVPLLTRLPCRSHLVDLTALRTVPHQCKRYTTLRNTARHCKPAYTLSFQQTQPDTQHNALHTTHRPHDDAEPAKPAEPELTEEQKAAEQAKIVAFLTPIKCDEFADKFTTFAELLSTHSMFLKLKHNIPCQQRKAIRKAVDRHKHKQFVLNKVHYADEFRRVQQLEEELQQQYHEKEIEKFKKRLRIE